MKASVVARDCAVQQGLPTRKRRFFEVPSKETMKNFYGFFRISISLQAEAGMKKERQFEFTDCEQTMM